ncbi:MAG: cupin domain-containing protein [Thermoplasmata archaeon]|nr:cupin domain-containing protein [Thermoplasmata archaeon]
MPEIVRIEDKKKALKKSFSKMPLLLVDNSYLGITRFKGRYKLHTHNRDELFYVLDGQLEIEVEKKKYTLDPGDAILIKKGEEHLSLSDTETHVLVFEPQNIRIKYLED